MIYPVDESFDEIVIDLAEAVESEAEQIGVTLFFGENCTLRTPISAIHSGLSRRLPVGSTQQRTFLLC